VVKLILWY